MNQCNCAANVIPPYLHQNGRDERYEWSPCTIESEEYQIALKNIYGLFTPLSDGDRARVIQELVNYNLEHLSKKIISTEHDLRQLEEMRGAFIQQLIVSNIH